MVVGFRGIRDSGNRGSLDDVDIVVSKKHLKQRRAGPARFPCPTRDAPVCNGDEGYRAVIIVNKAAMNAGRSSGRRLLTRRWAGSTQTGWSTQLAPALVRSSVRPGVLV